MTLLQRLGRSIGPSLITMLMKSLRVTPLPASIPTPAIIVFWHGGMLVPWYVHRHQRSAALVSRSADGDILAALLTAWGIEPIRGSSSEGGKEALDLMTASLRDGSTLLITPDGPRGPRHELKIGALVAAQRTGVPIVLCAPTYRSSWHLKSWDRFEIPRPFSGVDLIWSAPISIPTDCVGEPLERERISLQQQLMALTPRTTRTTGDG